MTPVSLARKTSVEIAIPVYNEEETLRRCIEEVLVATRSERFSGYRITLTIVNNASTDNTLKIANELAKEHEGIKIMDLPQKGRGMALRRCWKESSAQILAYMDADLSADLKYLGPLLDVIAKGNAEIAIGSRLVKGAKVTGRTISREVMSRTYNALIRLIFQTTFSDAQCGFKAIKKEAFHELASRIQNQNWFFDSEMLIIAQKLGMRIAEIPLVWHDDPSSTVKIARTAGEDLLGLIRLWRTKPWKTSEKR